MELHIPQNVYNKIMHWVNKANFEVSGFGRVQVTGKTIEVLDAYLIKQEGGAAHTEIDEVALGKLMYEVREQPGVLRFWWHSHVNMDVFWSSTDKNTIEQLGAQGWCVATVFNKKEEMRTAICYKANSPLGEQVVFRDEVKTYITFDGDSIAEWDKEFADKVIEKKWQAQDYSQWDKSWYSREYNSKPSAQPTMFDNKLLDDEEYYRQHGLIGYGVESESAVLSMNPKKYLKILKQKPYVELHDMIDRLEAAEKRGRFGNAKPYT